MSHVIGIDVSKSTLDCAYLRDAEQKKSRRKTCQNEPAAFILLLQWAESISGLPRPSLTFIVEPTSIYHESIVDFLYATGAKVFLVNPGRVRKFAQGVGILSKNDIVDADLLARYGLLTRKLIAYEPAPAEIDALHNLLTRLTALDKHLRQELNRQEKTYKTKGLHPLERESITRMIDQMKSEIILFKKAIRQHIRSTPSLRSAHDLLITIPGVGEKTACAMIVILIGHSFESASSVASFLGLNPIEKRSGQSEYRRPRLSKSGNRHYRQLLYFPALVAIKKNADIRLHYERLVARGKPKMCAIGAAMRKLVHICYGVLKHQQPYQVQTQQSSG